MRGRVIFDPDDGAAHLLRGYGRLFGHDSTFETHHFVRVRNELPQLSPGQLMEELTQLPVTLELASDVLDRQCPFFRNDSSFSFLNWRNRGHTPRMEYAKSRSTLHGIGHVAGSAISAATHCGLHINAGAEIGVASTKAYTCQIMSLILLALALSELSLSLIVTWTSCAKPHASQTMHRALDLDDKMKKLAHSLVAENSSCSSEEDTTTPLPSRRAQVKEIALLHSEGILGEMNTVRWRSSTKPCPSSSSPRATLRTPSKNPSSSSFAPETPGASSSPARRRQSR